MLMIIFYHFLVHGAGIKGPLENYSISDNTSVLYILLKSFLVIAVNCFVFISGFYQIKFKLKTVLVLLLQVLFYSILFTLIGKAISYKTYSMIDYAKALWPLFSGVWWFITAYIALYLLSPLLNTASNFLPQKKFLLVVINLTLLNFGFGFFFGATPIGALNGYSLISFINIYLLAQYIKKHVDTKLLEQYAFPIYVVNSLLIFFMAFIIIVLDIERGIGKIFDYNNPLVLLAAIGFFFSFKRLRLDSHHINNISPYVLGVYLFHDHPLMRIFLIDNLYEFSINMAGWVHFIILFCMTLFVFLIGFSVDKVREFLTAPILGLLMNKLKLEKLQEMISDQRKVNLKST